MQEELMVKILPIIKALRTYHRHEVVGLSNIPKRGPAIIATNHSLATYDILMLMQAVLGEYDRFPRSLIDSLFYKIPKLGNIMEKLGCVPGNHPNAKSLLSNGELVYIAPGGMMESLRPSTNRYKIMWESRKGFAKLAIDTNTPIVLAACPKADDIFEIYENSLSKWIYKNLKLPTFIAHGLGFTPVPNPIPLVHLVSEPIYPPQTRYKDEALDDFHTELIKRMKKLMQDAISLTERRNLVENN